nr:prolyl oligopeptidase family serine peptidase [Ornithinimicrobium sp. F0845]
MEYGDHPDQVVDLTEPVGPAAGVAFLVHGGYWRARFTRDLMEPLAADLAGRGWVVANVEYRRVGTGGGWPQTPQDVAAGLALVARLRVERGWPGRLVSVGHSVGGQLALLAAQPVDAVVALAPVTDLARTRAERLGEDAVQEFIPEPPEERPEPYTAGSPIARLPVGRPVLVVHGDADTRVPPAHSADYVARARAAGDSVTELLLPGVDHLTLIDPAQPHWADVVRWMA